MDETNDYEIKEVERLMKTMKGCDTKIIETDENYNQMPYCIKTNVNITFMNGYTKTFDFYVTQTTPSISRKFIIYQIAKIVKNYLGVDIFDGVNKCNWIEIYERTYNKYWDQNYIDLMERRGIKI
ncbi:MAG: hypothetical protein QXF15_02520 [Candidatus Aenigmatarchaeota archaeon]